MGGTELVVGGLDKDTAIVTAYVRSGGNVSATIRRLRAEGVRVGRRGVQSVVDGDPEAAEVTKKILERVFAEEAVERLQGYTAEDVQFFVERAIPALLAIYENAARAASVGNVVNIWKAKQSLEIAVSLRDTIDKLVAVVQRFKDGLHPKAAPILDQRRFASLDARTGVFPEVDGALKEGDELDNLKRQFGLLRGLREGALGLEPDGLNGKKPIPGANP